LKPDLPTRPPSTFGGSTGYPSFADTMQAARQAVPSPVAGGTFDVCHAGLALRAVLYVQAVLGIATLMWAGTLAQATALVGPVVFCGLLGTLGWLLVVCAARHVLGRATIAPRAVFVLAAGAASALGAFAALVPFQLTPATPSRWAAIALAGAAFSGTLWSWLVLRVRSRLPAEAAARLAELQARIRPHFLFNALNTAVALVRVDPARAEEVLEDLAQLFRTALEDHGQAVTLAEEVDLAQRYLAIEQVRFGDRLRVRWELDPAAGAARVPPLLLQPLVENAVRHGVEPSPEGGDVVVRTRVRRGQAVVDILNTMTSNASQPGHGMALQNVRERLRLLHDVAAQFEARREGGHYRVKIEVPL